MARNCAEISEKLRPPELVMKGAIFRGGVTPPNGHSLVTPRWGGGILTLLHYRITSQIFVDVQFVVF